jgi:hypothetical protein
MVLAVASCQLLWQLWWVSVAVVAIVAAVVAVQVCYTNTRTADVEVKELPGTLSNMGNDTENEKNDSLCETVLLSPIPIFSRIWSVTIDQTRTMFCYCKHFERIGLLCVHMACVAKLCHETSVFGSHTSTFSGFTHHDIAVRWWSSYMYHAYRSSTPSHIIEKYHLLAMNSINSLTARSILAGEKLVATYSNST